MNDPIQERGKSLEALFFAVKDQQLLAKLKNQMDAEESRSDLESASGIHNTAVLDALLEQKITPETLTTVGLIPLVAIAWADGNMEESERNAILRAAEASGIGTGTASHTVLEQWLQEEPSGELLASWSAYIAELKGTMEPAAFNQLKSSILDRAESVAKAAGGFLGLGSKISAAEQAVLDELKGAFD
jgi:hypothetical protein